MKVCADIGLISVLADILFFKQDLIGGRSLLYVVAQAAEKSRLYWKLIVF